jgi:nucleoside-diphosphate-sugar epimerase
MVDRRDRRVATAMGEAPPVVRVVVAGGHGQVARRLERRLASAGYTTTGIVRNPTT